MGKGTITSFLWLVWNAANIENFYQIEDDSHLFCAIAPKKGQITFSSSHWKTAETSTWSS